MFNKTTSIELAYVKPLDYIKIYCDDMLVAENYDCNFLKFSTDLVLPSKITINFSPFKIKPIVRLNNFMLNFWLADIMLYDHCLEFVVKQTFFQDYKNKDIVGRIAYLPDEQKNVEHFWDKYIGINNMHVDLVNQIKQLINP